MKLRIGATLAGLPAALALALGGPARAEEIEVLARKATEAPVIDGKVDRVWDAVRAVKVTASEGPQGDVEITVKALYTDRDVYFLFQWPDKTQSLGRFWEYTGTEWRATRGNEDRLNVAWDMGAKDFAQKGCTAACHKQGKEVTFRTTGSDRLDIWHWKSHRTNPAGWMDDQWLGAEVRPADRSARSNDSPGGTKANWDASAKRPRWGFKEGVRPGPVLLARDAVELRESARFKAGDRLPRDVVEKPTGSRGDIEARGVWDRGRWTLEVRRARDTGDRDHDVQFTDPGKAHLFGLSVHDDAGDDEHSHTGRTVLKLLLK
jgi:hypothetical protein